MYYLEDYSLGEIAEEFDVSRQAVYDNIRRTESMLEEYEEKLDLYRKFKQRNELIHELKERVNREETIDKSELLTFIQRFENLD